MFRSICKFEESTTEEKVRGKRFQNWADVLVTKVPASSMRSCLHWLRKTCDIFQALLPWRFGCSKR